MYVKSGTSGNLLPATVIRSSKSRTFFGLPNTLVEYIGTNRAGPLITTHWFYKSELVD